MRARLVIVISVLSLPLPLPRTALADESPDFEREMAPLLVAHCLDCHHPNKRSGKLNLSTLEGLLAGGEQGPAITSDKPAASLILQRIADGEMPPKDAKGHGPLTDA